MGNSRLTALKFVISGTGMQVQWGCGNPTASGKVILCAALHRDNTSKTGWDQTGKPQRQVRKDKSKMLKVKT